MSQRLASIRVPVIRPAEANDSVSLGTTEFKTYVDLQQARAVCAPRDGKEVHAATNARGLSTRTSFPTLPEARPQCMEVETGRRFGVTHVGSIPTWVRVPRAVDSKSSAATISVTSSPGAHRSLPVSIHSQP